MEYLHVYDLVLGDGRHCPMQWGFSDPAFENDQDSLRLRDGARPGHAATTRPDLRSASALTPGFPVHLRGLKILEMTLSGFSRVPRNIKNTITTNG